MSENLTRLEQEATAKAKRLAEEFQGKVDSLKNRIGDVERQKLGVKNGRISKAEAIDRMKSDLRKGFDSWIMEKFVGSNLRTYQSGHFRPLQNFDHLKVHQLSNAEWLNFIFAWVTPEMVDRASEELEEGPDEKTRMAKIAQLDAEISKLERELENLLK